jgi:hypothetical protein
MAYTKYSLTPADNNAAPPNGAPEGMLPSAVNDTMRDMMSQIRDVGDGIRGGTYTMTAPVITGGSITGVALSGNTLTSPVITGGSINNTTVGATTRSTGAFTTLASNGATTFTAGTASTSTTTGTAVITGGLGVSGRINAANFDGIVGANTAAAGNFTTLGATGVATFSAGTVSAPAITITGDTNTGIFFPAADTIAFTEGGTEVQRITSDGFVGIGTTNPAYKLHVVTSAASSAAFRNSGAANSQILIGNTAGDTQIQTIAAGDSFIYSDSSKYLALGTNGGTERMRITSTGNVGIGTSSPNQKLEVIGNIVGRTSNSVNANSDFRLLAGAYTGNAGTIITYNGTSGSNEINYGGATGIGEPATTHIFLTGTAGSLGVGTEKMRITSAGNVGIGVTPSAWVTHKALQIGARASISSGTTLTQVGNNYFYDGSYKYIATAASTAYQQDAGVHAWFNAPSGTAGNAITFTQAMTLDASGNLLLGTTSQLRSGLASFAGSSTSVNQLVLADTNAYNASPTVQQTFTFKSNTAGTYVDGGFIRVTKANATDGNTLSNMTFATNTGSAAVEAMRIDSSGNLLVGITSARANAGDVQVSKGISFPATQSAQSDANTLDDYEEGTFAPTDASGAGLTFSSANGYYTKVGRLVTLTMNVVYPSTANATAAKIGGFPFANGGANAGGYLIGSDCSLNLNFRIDTTTSTHISSGGTFTAVTNLQLSAKQVQLVYIMYV